MIDHVSIGVRDLAASAAFYAAALKALGYTQLVTRAETIGFGKKYAEFWLNARPRMVLGGLESGMHVCLRAASEQAVDAFHAAALAAGATSDGEPGRRSQYNDAYYPAFVRDPEGNRIEAATFITPDPRRA
jgi:catechol 2,3-dioxygenase-like lactoylglutathione lyase family enzyme